MLPIHELEVPHGADVELHCEPSGKSIILLPHICAPLLGLQVRFIAHPPVEILI
jgi:hypothetical protein